MSYIIANLLQKCAHNENIWKRHEKYYILVRNIATRCNIINMLQKCAYDENIWKRHEKYYIFVRNIATICNITNLLQKIKSPSFPLLLVRNYLSTCYQALLHVSDFETTFLKNKVNGSRLTQLYPFSSIYEWAHSNVKFLFILIDVEFMRCGIILLAPVHILEYNLKHTINYSRSVAWRPRVRS